MRNFFKDAERVLASLENIKHEPCMDQIVGEFVNNNYQSLPRKDIDYEQTTLDARPIIIILESPHKDEFDNFGAIGPASGRTGINFNKYFDEAIKKTSIYKYINDGVKRDVILLNSVQYQCSKGLTLTDPINKKMRDDYWMYIFSNGGKEDLIKRINFLNPILIVNLCTKGTYDLQSKVETIMNSLNIEHFYHIHGAHPCIWYNQQYAKIEK